MSLVSLDGFERVIGGVSGVPRLEPDNSACPGWTVAAKSPPPDRLQREHVDMSQRLALSSRRAAPGAMIAALLMAGTFSSAAELRGKVTNGTTNRPAPGSEVVLISLSQSGMKEVARSATDSAGRYRLTAPDMQTPQLVRVTYQGVTYHKIVKPGDSSVAVAVYDAVERLAGVTAVMDVQRFEATTDMLEVKELVTMRNASIPPRTLMNDRPFEIQLPPDAQVESGLVQIEDGQPLKYKPTPGEQKGRYYFLSPLRPGDTRFAVVYRLPYKGVAAIEPRLLNPRERFVVMLPKSMKFEPAAEGVFVPMPGVTEDNVLGTAPVRPGQTVAFRISGMGVLAELEGRRQQQAQAAEAKRPGGGLGAPIELPDPLHKQRWYILGGFAIVLVLGARHVVRRSPAAVPLRHELARPSGRRTGKQRAEVRPHAPRKQQGGVKGVHKTH